MRFTIHDTYDALDPLWEQWEASGELTVFQTRAFVRAWHETAGGRQGREPRLVLAEAEGGPAMLLPLALRKRYGMRVLEFAGGLLADYEAPVLAPGCPLPPRDDFRDAWRRIVAACGADVAHLRQIPAHIPGPGAPAPNPLALLPTRPASPAYAAVPNGLTFAEYIARTTKKSLRQDSRRQLKRLGEIGEVAYLMAETPEEAERLTRVMIAQKRRRFAETGGFDHLSLPGQEDFYLRFARSHCAGDAAPRAHVSGLSVGGEVIAAHWGLVFRGRFSFLMPTYDGGKWRRYSAGRLLMERLMEDCFAGGGDVFDFTVGGEAYKADWCNVEEPIHEAVTPATLSGRAYAALLHARRRWQDKKGS